MIRRIYFALVRKPLSFENLIKITGVDEATLAAALDFLKEKGMIVNYNFTTKCVMFRMVRTLPLRYGWNFPWLDLMMSIETGKPLGNMFTGKLWTMRKISWAGGS